MSKTLTDIGVLAKRDTLARMFPIGDYVLYVPRHAMNNPNHPDCQRGRIKSHSEHGVFVVFKCDNDWNNFRDYTAQLTEVSDLLRINREGHITSDELSMEEGT